MEHSLILSSPETSVLRDTSLRDTVAARLSGLLEVEVQIRLRVGLTSVGVSDIIFLPLVYTPLVYTPSHCPESPGCFLSYIARFDQR